MSTLLLNVKPFYRFPFDLSYSIPCNVELKRDSLPLSLELEYIKGKRKKDRKKETKVERKERKVGRKKGRRDFERKNERKSKKE